MSDKNPVENTPEFKEAQSRQISSRRIGVACGLAALLLPIVAPMTLDRSDHYGGMLDQIQILGGLIPISLLLFLLGVAFAASGVKARKEQEQMLAEHYKRSSQDARAQSEKSLEWGDD